MEKSNHLHNGEHVVQSTFQNILIAFFYHKPINSSDEFSSELNLIKLSDFCGGEGGANAVNMLITF